MLKILNLLNDIDTYLLISEGSSQTIRSYKLLALTTLVNEV
jgi:hypothetical protein